MVGQFREPFAPVRIDSINDLHTHPNDILLSRLLERINLSAAELTALFWDPTTLNCYLDLASRVPSLHRTAYDCPVDVVAALRRHNVFAATYEDCIIAATEVPATFTYPSGKSVSYRSLVNEVSANLSVFTFGFGDYRNNNIYIRSHFCEAMISLFRARQDDLALEQYLPIFDVFPQRFIGIALAHELCEIKLMQDGCTSRGLEIELLAEKKARAYLAREGENPLLYALFHALRAGPNNGQPNISREVLKTLN